MRSKYKSFDCVSLIKVTYLAIIYILLLSIPCFSSIKFSQPGGNFAVGMSHYVLVDPPREELYGERVGQLRKIAVRIWYPGIGFEMLGKAPIFIGGNLDILGIAGSLDIDPDLLTKNAESHGNAIPNTPVAEGYKYPVIIISHTLKGASSYYTDIAENLASYGYIVVAIDHTYAAAVTNFGNGEAAYWNPDILYEPQEISGKILISVFRNDLLLVLKTLETFESGFSLSPFKGILDLDRIGLIGHGVGAGAAVNLLFDEYRIGAFVGLDPWLEWVPAGIVKAGVHIPSLLIISEEWQKKSDYESIKTLFEQSSKEHFLLKIEGTKHFDFTILGKLNPIIKEKGYTGNISVSQMEKIRLRLIHTFFDSQFKNSMKDVKEIIEEFPEVSMYE